MSSIQLKTEVPGPRSKALLARRVAAVPTGLGKATDVVVERAEGALVHDVDGNTFIDFVGGIGALAVGHCPPPVVQAIQAEAPRLIHMGSLVGTYESYVRLCELLNEIDPGDVRQEDAALQQRRRGGGERGQGGAGLSPGDPASSASKARITAARCWPRASPASTGSSRRAWARSRARSSGCRCPTPTALPKA